MIIFLAGFLSIPKDYYEAAAIDGASGLQVLRFVTLPAMTDRRACPALDRQWSQDLAFQQIVTDGGPARRRKS